jgi:hypothetical protein
MSPNPTSARGDDASEQPRADVEPHIELDGRTATLVADLLTLLAETPSTPGQLRDEVEERAEELGLAIPHIPHQWAAGQRRAPDAAQLDLVTATGIAGMLELLAELPSTPPDIADDARSHAETIWALINEERR